MDAQLLQGADPAPYPGGFLAVAGTRARPGDDPGPATSGLRSTARFRWPVISPHLEAWDVCTGDLLVDGDDPGPNGLYELGPVRPVVPITTTVECSLLGPDRSKWEQAARDQHTREFPHKVARLATRPAGGYTDGSGNTTANLYTGTLDASTVVGPVAATGFDGATEAVVKFGIAAALSRVRGLGALWFPFGFGWLLAVNDLINMDPGSLPTAGPNRVPLIDDPGFTPSPYPTDPAPGPMAVAVFWTGTPSVRVSPVTVDMPEERVATNDGQVIVTQLAVWDWPPLTEGYTSLVLNVYVGG